jgi:hypothetical protein
VHIATFDDATLCRALPADMTSATPGRLKWSATSELETIIVVKTFQIESGCVLDCGNGKGRLNATLNEPNLYCTFLVLDLEFDVPHEDGPTIVEVQLVTSSRSFRTIQLLVWCHRYNLFAGNGCWNPPACLLDTDGCIDIQTHGRYTLRCDGISCCGQLQPPICSFSKPCTVWKEM